MHSVTGCLFSNSARQLGGRISKGQISKEEEEWTSGLGHVVTILSRNLKQKTPSEKLMSYNNKSKFCKFPKARKK
jgi:hypothetical protein